MSRDRSEREVPEGARGHGERARLPARPAGPGRPEAILALQRTAGNTAVGALVARAPREGAESSAPAAAVARLDSSIGNRGVAALLQRTPAPKGPTPGVRAAANLSAEVDETWSALKAFVVRATPQVKEVKKRITTYLGEYEKAYGSFEKTLEDAERESEATEKWSEVAMAILVGTGIGLAAAELFEAGTMLGKLVHEVAAEGTKEGTLHLLQSPGPSFTPPPGLSLSDKAAEEYEPWPPRGRP